MEWTVGSYIKLTMPKILSGVETPSACNHEGFNETYTKAVTEYIQEHSFTEIANRYAANLASGRFFWRNRVGCEELEVKIDVLNNENEKAGHLITWILIIKVLITYQMMLRK